VFGGAVSGACIWTINITTLPSKYSLLRRPADGLRRWISPQRCLEAIEVAGLPMLQGGGYESQEKAEAAALAWAKDQIDQKARP
jgi:hypothetical protein